MLAACCLLVHKGVPSTYLTEINISLYVWPRKSSKVAIKVMVIGKDNYFLMPKSIL